MFQNIENLQLQYSLIIRKYQFMNAKSSSYLKELKSISLELKKIHFNLCKSFLYVGSIDLQLLRNKVLLSVKQLDIHIKLVKDVRNFR